MSTFLAASEVYKHEEEGTKYSSLVPELHIVPRYVHSPRALVRDVRANFVIETAPWRLRVTVNFFAVNIQADAALFDVMDCVETDGFANIGNVPREELISVDAIQLAPFASPQSKVRLMAAFVDDLSDGDTCVGDGVDGKGATKLVHAGGVVVVVATLGAEVAVVAAGPAAI